MQRAIYIVSSKIRTRGNKREIRDSVRIDWFDDSDEASSETYVYDAAGNKVGVYGPHGWIDEHGFKEPPKVLECVANALRGKTIDILRKLGIVAEKGAADIAGESLAEIAAEQAAAKVGNRSALETIRGIGTGSTVWDAFGMDNAAQ